MQSIWYNCNGCACKVKRAIFVCQLKTCLESVASFGPRCRPGPGSPAFSRSTFDTIDYSKYSFLRPASNTMDLLFYIDASFWKNRVLRRCQIHKYSDMRTCDKERYMNAVFRRAQSPTPPISKLYKNFLTFRLAQVKK